MPLRGETFGSDDAQGVWGQGVGGVAGYYLVLTQFLTHLFAVLLTNALLMLCTFKD